MDFIAVKNDGGGGTNWNYKTHKSPVKMTKMTPPKNQQPIKDLLWRLLCDNQVLASEG